MDNKQSNQQNTIRIDLTDQQQKQVRQATGKSAQAIELSAHELEERVSPSIRAGR